MKFKSINNDLYNSRVWVFADCNIDQLYKKLARRNVNYTDDGTGWEAFHSRIQFKQDGLVKRTVNIIWIDKSYKFYSLLHEVVHLVNDIFERCNVKWDSDNDEHYAYYLEHMFRKIWRAIGEEK